MSSPYNNMKIGKLVLKGEKKAKKSKKCKTNQPSTDQSKGKKVKKHHIETDAVQYNGWWKVSSIEQITGTVSIEFGKRTFLKAMDNGTFMLGAPHPLGNGPLPEEIFSAFVVNDCKVSFKTGYGKYMKCELNGNVTGRSEAVSSQEQWEPRFENGKMALFSNVGVFMSINPKDDTCVAVNKTVSELEICVIRSNAEKEVVKDEGPVEERGNLSQIEKNYVKKFQKFQNKLLINHEGIGSLETAKRLGNLHETLLDRRSKMKADRYCK